MNSSSELQKLRAGRFALNTRHPRAPQKPWYTDLRKRRFVIIQFQIEELSPKSKIIYERAQLRAKRYLKDEAELLESIIELINDRTFEAFGETYITPFVVKYLGLSEDVAANFVRVANKSILVPDLQKAIDEGKITVNQAKVIAPVLTPTTLEWIDKAEQLSKHELEKEVAIANPRAPTKERAKPVAENRNKLEMELDDETFLLLKRAREVEAGRTKKMPTLAELQKQLLEAYLDKQDPIRKAERSRDGSKTKFKHETNRRDQGQCQAQMPDGTRCGAKLWVQQHHVHEKQYGGLDAVENMTTLCASHHRMWHRREESVSN